MNSSKHSLTVIVPVAEGRVSPMLQQQKMQGNITHHGGSVSWSFLLHSEAGLMTTGCESDGCANDDCQLPKPMGMLQARTENVFAGLQGEAD